MKFKTKSDWIWMPHAAHFCCADYCRFKLATCVGDYIVSTVGEYYPDSRIRAIFADCRGVEIEGIGQEWDNDYNNKMGNYGFENIGSDRLYETMVFVAKKTNHKCCPYVIESGHEIDMAGYNSPELAYKGHMRLCNKWFKKGKQK